MSVIVFGSVNLDLVAKVQRRPQPGETLLASGFTSTPGGKGANQALAARNMGASVILVGAVGNDSFAEPALSLLQRAGVDLSHVTHLSNSSTGLAFIHLDEQGENSITVVPGANYQAGIHGLEVLEQILTAQDILVMQLEIPLTVVQQAIAIAKRKGATILIDPAPSINHIPEDLLQVDIFIPNRGEAAMILNQSIEDIEQAQEAARQLHKRGAKLGVVKLGSEGVVWANDQETGYQPALKVKTVDSTGAGDAFAGALAAILNQKTEHPISLANAMQQANMFAALTTTALGAQQSYPTLAQVQQWDRFSKRGV